MRIKYYNSKDERKTILDDANSLGESIIHDDFLDKDGNATDGTKGKLTLDVVASVPNPDFVRLKELNQKLDDDTITFDELKELLRLQP